MSEFKDMIAFDNQALFMELDDFAELHWVAGKQIPVIFDDDALKKRQGGEELSIAESTMLMYARTCDLPCRAKNPVGTTLNIDNAEYIVDDWQEDMGISSVSLRQNILA